MARNGFSIEKLLDLHAENGDYAGGVQLLFGGSAPGGDAGEQDDAPIGSLYLLKNGTSSVVYQKIADTNATSDWRIVPAVLSGSYTPGSGNPASGDSIEDAIEKIDGNVDDLNTLTGLAQGATDLGTFTGDIISDNDDIIGAFQSLETELVDTRDNVDDLITLSGVAENATDLGTFTGSTIADNETIKGALQDLETAVEASGLTMASATGVTTAATVDEVLVDDYGVVKWIVQVFEEATPANKKFMEVFAGHNGTASADASAVDDTVYGKLDLGSDFDLTISVDLNGTGASQTMRLRAASGSAGVTVKATRVPVNA